VLFPAQQIPLADGAERWIARGRDLTDGHGRLR
jgi:hypothetical protein